MANMKNVVELHPYKGILKGAELLYNAVKSTAGASGRNVLIKNGVQPLVVTKDGFTVAKSIEIEDHLMGIGAEAMLSASESANDISGDGSTATVVIGYNLLKEGLKAKRLHNPIEMAEQIKEATEKVQEELKRKVIKDFKSLDVAMISTNGDIDLSKNIVSAIDIVGKDGTIFVERSNTRDTYVKRTEGISFESGLLSPYLINNSAKASAKFTNAMVLIIDGDAEKFADMYFYLEASRETEMPLVVIANDYNNEVINLITANKIKNNVPIIAIKSPFYGEKRTLFLNDLSKMLGATLISEKNGNIVGLGLKGKKKNEKIAMAKHNIGYIKEIQSTMSDTIIHYHEPNTEYLEKMKEELKTKDNYIEERYNIITSKVATIFIGAETEVELNEKMFRAEDATNAVKSAIDDGVVVGGGLALYNASQVLKGSNVGERIMRKVCAMPSKVILANTGNKLLYTKIHRLNLRNEHKGYDVKKKKVCNMNESGIIDPLKVISTSLEHASSVVRTLLTSDVSVFNTKR